MNARPGFRCESLHKRFGAVTALNDVTLEFGGGTTTALIGPSGCGKSTLLRVLAGIAEPDTGRVRFGDQLVDAENSYALRSRLGFVIQDGGLFPHLTAAENVTLMARLRGDDSQRMRTRLDELAELASFPREGLDRYPIQLSGGQRQRVSLMRALMLDPDALLLDEPLGALDPMIRADLQELLRELFRTLQKTVVIVTHDLAEAAFFADRIVLMRDASIEQQGSMSDLLERPGSEFARKFVKAQRSLSELRGGAS